MSRRATSKLQNEVYVIIFRHDTPGGRLFDVVLLWAVLLSIAAVILESVDGIRTQYGFALRTAEWFFTVLFTIEYGLRIYCAARPIRYIGSFFGIIDLLAILPTYLSIVVGGAQSLLVVRVVRLLRAFRVLKLVKFYGQADALMTALKASLPKIIVFLGAVLSAVVIVGSGMYLIEGPEHGFTNIPRSMYWAIVTLTTVGFGDITPQTPAGQILASVLMILGYGIIAVPTGIVSAEIVRASAPGVRCNNCQLGSHLPDANFCRGCGAKLRPESPPQR